MPLYFSIGGAEMELNELIAKKHITKYRLSKNSNIPYATLNDICSGKTDLAKCSAETVYRLSKALDVSMEALLESCFDTRPAFELFKSNVCHRVKELGDIDFLIETLEKDDIRKYYKKKWYPECFYLLAMLDYLSRENNIPPCEDYNDLRKLKLKSVLYPSGVLSLASASKSDRPNLPNGWLNDDFKRTESYTRHLSEVSVFYKTFSSVLNVRTVSADYLVAMKLKAGRKYKNDLSDVVGILAEHKKNGDALTYEKIDVAMSRLYGGWETVPADSITFICDLLERGDYEAVYQEVRKNEQQAKDLLVDFMEKYPGAANAESADTILKALRAKKQNN